MKIIKLHKNKVRNLGIFVLFFVLIFVYYFFDPSKNGYFLKCPLKSVTGYECAGCGAQRAFHELLHLRLRDAFRLNPLFVITFPIATLIWIILQFCKGKTSSLQHFISSKLFLFLVLAVILLYSLTRNTAIYKSIFLNF